MKTVKELKDTDKGLWQVKTEASSYIIDLDERQFMRNPGEGLGAHPAVEGRTVRTNPMDIDSRWVNLWKVVNCKIDEGMVLKVQGFSMVYSTLVRSIEQLAEDK